jgi:hypothetical protein
MHRPAEVNCEPEQDEKSLLPACFPQPTRIYSSGRIDELDHPNDSVWRKT